MYFHSTCTDAGIRDVETSPFEIKVEGIPVLYGRYADDIALTKESQETVDQLIKCGRSWKEIKSEAQ